MGDRVECLLEVHKAYTERVTNVACRTYEHIRPICRFGLISIPKLNLRSFWCKTSLLLIFQSRNLDLWHFDLKKHL